jgi:3-dehydroquinate synthase
MIGAFYQPRAVIADTSTLDTLPDRELSAGIAEVIKYGLIRDLAFFNWLQQNMAELLERDSDALAYAIEVSCRNKAEVVAADEKESGQRALLNLGHTFGHAIEAGLGYGKWLHGEAVAAGMCMAAIMSQQLDWIDTEDVEHITRIIDMARLPVNAPNELSVERFVDLMSVDKKVMDGVLRLVLLRDIGHAVITNEYTQEQLEAAIRSSYPA